MNEGAGRAFLLATLFENGVSEILVGEAVGTSEGVFAEVLDEAAGEGPVTGGDLVAQLEEAVKFRAVGQGAGVVDGVLLRIADAVVHRDVDILHFTPETDGVEMFESITDGIDLAVALGALSFLHVRLEQFAGGQELAGVT